MIKQKHYESHRRDGDFYFFQMILADSITLGVCLPGIRDNVHYGSFFVEKCTRYKGQEMFQKAPGFSGGVAQRRTKKNSTSVRIELTILRLTVARLNQLGHEVFLLYTLRSVNLSLYTINQDFCCALQSQPPNPHTDIC